MSTSTMLPQPSVINTLDMTTALVSSLSLDPSMTSNLIPTSSQSVSMPTMPTLVAPHCVTLPVRFYGHVPFDPLPLHKTVGRNICISVDRTIAVRRVEEYCNSYVFTDRPIQLGEKIVVQILSIDYAYTGGLAFGMTACDPGSIQPADLPDDSDLLLDRPEYWVVNKDVCSNPEVGDELSFGLTEEGMFCLCLFCLCFFVLCMGFVYVYFVLFTFTLVCKCFVYFLNVFYVCFLFCCVYFFSLFFMFFCCFVYVYVNFWFLSFWCSPF